MVAAAKTRKFYWDSYFKNLDSSKIRDDTLKRKIDRLKLIEEAGLNDIAFQEVSWRFVFDFFISKNFF